MPVTFQVGGIKNQQAAGPTLFSNKMALFAARGSAPTALLYLGGHRINDAPSAETVEGTTETIRSVNPITGENVETTRRLSPTTVRALTTNIVPPTQFIPRISQIRKLQANDRIHYILTPAVTDSDVEKRFAYVLQNGLLDDPTFTTGLVQWGEDAAEIERQYGLVTEGNALAYEALQESEITDDVGGPLYACGYVQSDDRGANPHQNFVAAGGAIGTPTATGWRTSNQFGAETAFNFTTINGSGGIGSVMDVLHYNGNYLFAISDVYKGTGTAGGVAYSNGTAEAVIPASLATSNGVQALVELNGIIYAFGTAGEAWKSCDGGFTWTPIVTGITEDILAADVDRDNNRIYLACSNAEAYVYNLNAFTEITGGTRFAPTAAEDLLSVAVVGNDQVLFGSDDGYIYESNEAYVGEYAVSYQPGDPVRALIGDGRNMRCVAGSDTNVLVRDILNQQNWEVVATTDGNITAITHGDEYPDEGMGFFLIATLTGELHKLDSYYPFNNIAC